MKQFLLIIFIIIVLMARGQEPSPLSGYYSSSWPGNSSEWYYEVQPLVGCLPCQVYAQHIQVTGDTVINGIQCIIVEKITPKPLCDDMGNTREYLYSENQKVYWYNETIDDFTILYDFSAGKGDTWDIKVADCSLTVTVDSTSTIMVGGVSRKVLHVSDERHNFTGSIIEQTGHTVRMFPSSLYHECQGYACDSDFINGLRCYLENGELIYKTGTVGCDSVYELQDMEINPITTIGNTWHVLRNISTPVHFTEIYRIEGDTLIEDKKWQVVSVTTIDQDNAENKKTKFYLQNDNGQLNYCSPGNLTSKLYFDFNAEVNDTLDLNSPFNNEIIKIRIDEISVVEVQGVNRRSYKVTKIINGTEYSDDEFWLEGIGSSNGIFYGNNDPLLVGVQCDLTCFSNNNVIIYPDNFTGECFLSNVSIRTIDIIEFDVYPNPAKDLLYLNALSSENIDRIIAIDITGKSFSLTIGKDNIVDIHELRNGIYLVKLFLVDGTSVSKKILKLN